MITNFKELEILGKLKKTTTTLDEAEIEYIKGKKYRINHLIRLGILAVEGNPQFLERIQIIEREMKGIHYWQENIKRDMEEVKQTLKEILILERNKIL